MVNILILVRIASLALGQSHDCPSASEATLKNMGKISWNLTTSKHKKLGDIIIGMYCEWYPSSLDLQLYNWSLHCNWVPQFWYKLQFMCSPLCFLFSPLCFFICDKIDRSGWRSESHVLFKLMVVWDTLYRRMKLVWWVMCNWKDSTDYYESMYIKLSPIYDWWVFHYEKISHLIDFMITLFKVFCHPVIWSVKSCMSMSRFCCFEKGSLQFLG